MKRRDFLFSGTTLLVLGACSNGTIDPAQVADALQKGCGIAVPLATIATIINAAIGGTVQSIVDLICSSYKSSLQAQGKMGVTLAAGTKITFVVHRGDKDIEVEATAVK